MSTTPSASEKTPSRRYDKWTITLHWATALIVIFLFASSQIWEQLERGTPWRKGLQSLHISFGIMLAALIVARLIWRGTAGKRLPAASSSLWLHRIAKLTHWALYLLLIGQVTLGFLFRWAQGEPFLFFGLFPVPDIFGVDPMLRRTFGMLHFYTAWTIIILAGLHACAALFHHYVLRDDTLKRMFPPAE
ncbi:cytochrome b [Sodalis sp. C49]|uniref:cytochrome b n=1 Tax=unclassified Sodalis (in: enterobacteria) TaxID=2636512 RepID=UPI003965C0C1